MYVSFAALQALDTDSTLRAIARGGREANPLVRGALESPAALIALKAGTAAGMIVVGERLRKHHPAAAIVLMGAVDAAYAAIVVHNYHIANR
jgi:hypothetical protein